MVLQYAAYDEIADFLAAMNPVKLVQFHASDNLQKRVEELLFKNREEGLTEAERSELEHYLVIDNLISLAKIRAQKMLNQTYQVEI